MTPSYQPSWVYNSQMLGHHEGSRGNGSLKWMWHWDMYLVFPDLPLQKILYLYIHNTFFIGTAGHDS